MTGWVFFSRGVRSSQDFEQAYSDADPTSETDSELVDTDGGYIPLPGSGIIHKILEWNSTVLVFAEHG